MSHERSSTPETISQQFIDYVYSHSDPATKIADVTREGRWCLNVKLPLMGDAVSRVSFIERRIFDEDNHLTDEHGYDILVETHKGLDAMFVHEPTNLDTPYHYHGHEGTGSGSVIEADIADLLAELKGYEASGLMSKIETPSSDR